MKVSAIICEYNPLHNGHVHHIRETKRGGATHLICLLSSSFVQRGDVALLSKFDRARLAVKAGADLVIELPSPFSCAAAEIYAGSAVSMLKSLGIVDELSFGCISGDMETISLLTEASLSTTQIYGERIRALMAKGNSYPAAVWEAVRQRYGNQVAGMMTDPNNLLAIEYMKAIQRQKAGIKPFPVARRCVMHDSEETDGQFASASFVRKMIYERDLSYTSFVPDYASKLIAERVMEGAAAYFDNLEPIILYTLRTMSREQLMELPDMTEALANRFYTARNANSINELFARIKTKCYTMARIRRITMSALLGLRRDIYRSTPPYARVLAFSGRGRELLGEIQRRSTIPVGTSLAKLRELGGEAARFVQIEERASQIYGLALDTIGSAEEDYRTRVILERAES